MFGQLGWGEILVILLVGLFVFGPERLPGVARDAGKMLRQLRSMANGVRDDIRSELGPEVADLDLASLNPRTFVAKHLFQAKGGVPEEELYQVFNMGIGMTFIV